MKRFYERARAVEDCGGGWTVALDGKPIRTPAKAAFRAPGRALAEAAAAEWEAQRDEVTPAAMPITRAVNTALDRTAKEFDAVAGMVAAYGGSDLLCYRAEAPEPLIMRQAAAWDPLIDWAASTFDARLVTTTGVMPALQPAEGQTRLAEAVAAHDPFELTALYDLVALSGSLVIGLAVARGHVATVDAWAASRIDETWQAELWGVDDEAEALARRKAGEFEAAARFIDLARAG